MAVRINRDVLDPLNLRWLRQYRPNNDIPSLASMFMLDMMCDSAQMWLENITCEAILPAQICDFNVVCIPEVTQTIQPNILLTPSFDVENISKNEGARFEVNVELLINEVQCVTARVIFSSTFSSPPESLAGLTSAFGGSPTSQVMSSYATAYNIYASDFRIMRFLQVGLDGSEILLDGAGVAAPVGCINPLLLEAVIHGIPSKQLPMWFSDASSDVVPVPAGIATCTFFGPTPTYGYIIGEIRTKDYDSNRQQASFDVHLSRKTDAGKELWLSMELLVSLRQRANEKTAN